jgi:predicted RNase H-like nuclease
MRLIKELDVEPWLAGVDGCRSGWVVAFARASGDEVQVRRVPDFASIIEAPEQPAVIAVDMPIGLPERAGKGGRPPENCVRSLLAGRQSSVFSIPSRKAVYAELGSCSDREAIYAAHRRAGQVARATSEPPRSIAIQAFMIFPKIREIDAVLRADPAAIARVFEVHPELAFWRLNGERALDEPKKVKSRPYPPGLALRRRLLIAAGLPEMVVGSAPPTGAGEDDLLDALACLAIARRIKAGIARSFPDPPGRDAFGLPIAIWA